MLHRIRVSAFFCATLIAASGVRGQAASSTAPEADSSDAVPAAPPPTTAPEAATVPATPLANSAQSGDGIPAADAEEPGSGQAGATPVPSAAQVEDEAAAARARAREAYAEGEAAFAEARYEAALTAFLRAYQTVPNPVVLLSVAETERRLGRVDTAIAHLTTFLDAAPSGDPRRPQVKADIEALLAVPATLRVGSDPAGAVVRVEGQSEQVVAPGELSLPAGKYMLLVEMPGHETVRTPVALEPGVSRQVDITLRPVAPTPAVQATDDDAVATWVAAGVGAAGLLTGSVLGFMALSENSDYDRSPSAASADRGERLALFADVALGVGAMGFITAAVMYFTDDAPADADNEANGAAAAPTFGVFASGDGAMGTARFQF